MAVILISNLIMLTFLIWKCGWKKVSDFSELKRFFFWAILMLCIGNVITLFKNSSYDIEYLYFNILMYFSFWMSLKVFELADGFTRKFLIKFAIFVSIAFIVIQALLSLNGSFWNWGETFLLEEMASVSGFSRFFMFLWMIFAATLGILVMQLMSEVNKDGEYVNTLVMVLFYLVIIVGAGTYGFFPRLWIWVFTGIYFGMLVQYLDIWIKVKEKSRPKSVNILGLKVDNLDTKEALVSIDNLIKKKKLNLVITPYSEFFVNIRKDKKYKKALEYAALSLPDGIYVNWASLYQRFPVSNNIVIRFFQSIWQYVFSGASIVLFPRLVRVVVKAHVSGSDIIYPVSELAAKKGYKVMLYGGFDFGGGNTGVLAAQKLKKMYRRLKIVEVYPGKRRVESDAEALKLINKHKPDILFMCLGTREPEWVYKRRNKMKAGVVFALGGTFDYVSGKAVKVHKNVSEHGLEWLVRPVMLKGTGGLKSSLKRFKRVWTGMIVGSLLVLSWKLKFGYIKYEKVRKT